VRYALRSGIARGIIGGWTRALYRQLDARLGRYRQQQQALARRYHLEGCEPEPYGEATRARIGALAADCREPGHFAWTSGTTRDPKQIFYPRSRLRALQRAYLEQVLLVYDYVGLTRPAFYFLGSMAPDDSISGLMARHPVRGALAQCVLSETIVHVPEVARLADRYSQAALHLALLLASEPVLIASVNPSSLCALLDQVHRAWGDIRAELVAILQEDWLAALRRRLGPAMEPRVARARRLCQEPECPAVSELLPELRVVYCWDGGYVRPFVDLLREQLAAIQARFMPMFSLSTETVAYQIYPRLTTEGGLPLYPGVCYEFLPAGEEGRPARVLRPWELAAGEHYLMLVSDAYGLRRYRTEDLFDCLGSYGSAPILRFVGRAGLNYSFTGEKITDQQLLAAYGIVRDRFRLEGVHFACFPKRNPGGIPGYLFACSPQGERQLPAELRPECFDEALMEVNREYAGKRESGRLTMPEVVALPYEELAARLLAPDPDGGCSSVAQFKLLPLYRVCWEDISGGGVQEDGVTARGKGR
jgi:hypothetical protein